MEYRNVVVVPAYNEEKTLSKTLGSLVHQSLSFKHIVVVDNNSTDSTGDIVRKFQTNRRGNSIIHLVTELKKGTGVACNTGFGFAINELKANIISRTDADTVPDSDWNEKIVEYFRTHPTKKIVSGPSYALRDEFYRGRDKVLWPIAQVAFRLGSVATTHSLFTTKFALGHNMAVRDYAFQEVGGFSNSSIDEADEDVEISKRMYTSFGLGAMGYERKMKVWTSMRRIDQLGYHGLVYYYWNPGVLPSQERRIEMTNGEIDKR